MSETQARELTRLVYEQVYTLGTEQEQLTMAVRLAEMFAQKDSIGKWVN